MTIDASAKGRVGVQHNDRSLVNGAGPFRHRHRVRRPLRDRREWDAGVVRDSNSGHQLLLPPANWCPIFASRAVNGMQIDTRKRNSRATLWPGGPEYFNQTDPVSGNYFAGPHTFGPKGVFGSKRAGRRLCSSSSPSNRSVLSHAGCGLALQPTPWRCSPTMPKLPNAGGSRCSWTGLKGQPRWRTGSSS